MDVETLLTHKYLTNRLIEARIKPDRAKQIESAS